jgi:DNA-directed RNA polymerase subunit F
MKEKEKKLEKILEKVLELLDQGKSVSEILNLFPEFETELKEIFQIVEALSKEKITPQKELLEKIISQIETEKPVTKEEPSRYIDKEGKLKGRPSLANFVENWINMADKWKVIVPVGVLVIATVLIVANQLLKKPSEISGPAVTPVSPKEVVGPAVGTGNVDDIVSAVLSDAFAEGSQTEKNMQDDVELLGLDSQAINDFSQVYNESEF